MSTDIRPTFWKEVNSPETHEVCLVRTEEPDAHFISSRMGNGCHRLLLDIDRTVEVVGNAIDLGSLFIKERYRLSAEWRKLGILLAHLGIGDFVPPSSVLTFAHPVEVRPSTTPGHCHLEMHMPDEALLEWQLLLLALEAFQAVGIVDRQWVDLAKRRKMAILLKPGIDKATAYAALHEANQRAGRRASLIYIESPYGGRSSPYGGGSGREF